MSTKRKTIEEINEILSKADITLLSEYFKPTDKHKFKCNKCLHIFSTALKFKLKQCRNNKIACPKCAMKKQVKNVTKINPETGLTRAQEIARKSAQTMNKKDPISGLSIYDQTGDKIKNNVFAVNETGLSKAKQRGLKTKQTKHKINSETGLTGYQETALLSAKTMTTTINPQSGLTIAKTIGQKVKKIKSQVDIDTGLTGYQLIGLKIQKALNKIDLDTGLSIAQKIQIKKRNTLNTINPETGFTIGEEINKRIQAKMNSINPETGLTYAKEKGIKLSRSKKNITFDSTKSRFDNIDYELLTTKQEYINYIGQPILSYKHKCGEIRNSLRQNRIRCLKCYPYNKSFGEHEVLEYCQSLSDNVISGDRHIIKPLELDIYMPDNNFAIEYDGLYWHSFNTITQEDKNVHLRKTKLCKEKSIQLLHIFENEWDHYKKQEIWKSIIKNKLGQSFKIFARKCEILEVSFKDSQIFLENNHLQGRCNSSINIGLFYNNELISLMTFGKSRFNKKVDWELLRFCNKLNYYVVGAASRLFKNFLKGHTGSVISYADMRYSDGKLYRNLGFEFEHISGPNYWYWKVNNGILLESRIQYQKHKLKGKLEEFDENLTETENMYNNGYRKIYDCGNQVWIYK